jgi:hypothetical protein
MGIQNAAPPKTEYAPDVPMPIGQFPATVAFAMVKATKTGKVMFSVKWKDAQERSAWQNIVVSPESPKAMEIFYRLMEAMGLTKGFLDADDTEPSEIAEAMVGATSTVTVEAEEWNGKTSHKVTWIS